ncbi:MAG: transaldolase family protein, partial [Pseudomonadota bacterium]|nr:transaldolase family protein [Pseudomonadota bacterium]
FRNVGEIQALAGCDRLTISPALLNELDELQGDLPRQLTPMGASSSAEQALAQADFRWQMNEDEMASDKLAEGIRKFMADQRKLEELLGKLRQS